MVLRPAKCNRSTNSVQLGLNLRLSEAFSCFTAATVFQRRATIVYTQLPGISGLGTDRDHVDQHNNAPFLRKKASTTIDVARGASLGGCIPSSTANFSQS